MLGSLVRDMLKALGEDPHREGLLKTPRRVAEALGALTEGYHRRAADVLNGAIFTPYDEMVVVKDIEVYSLCERVAINGWKQLAIAFRPAHAPVAG
jgi:GTP cyclohydrolase I